MDTSNNAFGGQKGGGFLGWFGVLSELFLNRKFCAIIPSAADARVG